MDGQVEKICDMAKKLCEREMYQEAWDAFYTVYKITNDAEVLDIMAEYFFVQNKAGYLDNYKKNISFFKNINMKLFGYKPAADFNDLTAVSKMLWKNDKDCSLYYLAKSDENGENKDCNWELRQQEIREGKIKIISREKCIMAVNVIPSCLPENDTDNIILYYDREIFECFLQVYDYSDFVTNGGVCGIAVNDGLEEFIRTNGKIRMGYFINNNKNQRLVQRCIDAQFAERHSFAEDGLYDGHTFYVIRIQPTSSSLGGLMHLVLEHLLAADKKGYIPVIDFSLVPSPLLEDDEIGKINPWECFFEQPTQFGVQAVHYAKM